MLPIYLANDKVCNFNLFLKLWREYTLKTSFSKLIFMVFTLLSERALVIQSKIIFKNVQQKNYTFPSSSSELENCSEKTETEERKS